MVWLYQEEEEKECTRRSQAGFRGSVRPSQVHRSPSAIQAFRPW